MKKSRKRKKHLSNFILTFSATLIGITIMGIVGLLLYSAISDKNQSREVLQSQESEEKDNFLYGLFSEEIPEEEIPKEESECDVRQVDEEEQQVQSRYADVLSDEDYMKANNIYPKETANEGEVVLAFAGDILFDPGYSVMAKLLQRPNGIHDSISEDLIVEMQNADIFMLNNEFPYSDRGTPTEGKQFTFRAKPEYADLLHEMGTISFRFNNHAYDYGEIALLDTLKRWKEQGRLMWCRTESEEAMKPVYFIAGDIKIAIVSATQIERLDNPDTKALQKLLPSISLLKFRQVIGSRQRQEKTVIL